MATTTAEKNKAHLRDIGWSEVQIASWVAESDAEFRDRLHRHGWDDGRIAAWEATGWDERADSMGLTGGVTGAEADIEANYEGGLAAFCRDERADRTPHHKGEIAGY